MGFLDRFRRSESNDQPRSPTITVTMSIQRSELEKITGTTTIAKDAAYALATRMNLGANGYLEIQATLQREPDNPVDPNAVTVNVHGERIGYVPSYVAS